MKISTEELEHLISEYKKGHSKPLNYEKYPYDEMNQVRWARERYERLAVKLAYAIAVELLERRKSESL